MARGRPPSRWAGDQLLHTYAKLTPASLQATFARMHVQVHSIEGLRLILSPDRMVAFLAAAKDGEFDDYSS